MLDKKKINTNNVSYLDRLNFLHIRIGIKNDIKILIKAHTILELSQSNHVSGINKTNNPWA